MPQNLLPARRCAISKMRRTDIRNRRVACNAVWGCKSAWTAAEPAVFAPARSGANKKSAR